MLFSIWLKHSQCIVERTHTISHPLLTMISFVRVVQLNHSTEWNFFSCYRKPLSRCAKILLRFCFFYDNFINYEISGKSIHYGFKHRRKNTIFIYRIRMWTSYVCGCLQMSVRKKYMTACR